MHIEQLIKNIGPLDGEAMQKAVARLNNLTKPIGSLGVLEDLAIQLAGITGEVMPKVANKMVIVMAGDHGVVEEGVSSAPQSVTPQMVYNFLNGGAGINVLSRCAGAQVKVVDVGVADPTLKNINLISRKVRLGTANMAKGPAMSREEALQAIQVGVEVAEGEIDQGINLLATGEMGIGNTTPSSAILKVYSAATLSTIVGRGVGLNDEGLLNKIKVIETAIMVNKPDPADPIDVLSKVGGLEIAGMTGLFLGAAARKVPIVIDGFISGAAALIAYKLAPQVKDYMIASHLSEEPGHKLVLEAIGLEPMLRMRLRLGEGTGAALAFNIIEAATRIMSEMATFEEAGVIMN
ncbi:Nicotinate-nucleotide--dimethylbenzimidazole phosphoribosyltransferase [Sporotomaculum syntrophicum]|uniref:Nicotinate-nucleotide--dimethylbenzimidazole phosphoribosyltransferase n=1 Tax=Sporotomaculum syntrophicum TaxID=182264 RepID=A0A9D2WN61_9FIRM|nr:nicotinate-nucleotide--dimethylbenzimidazole phosphoribosyltransferase [Sporotomaculum syntrophicum]KAF1084495.1 Nicotinate-nucleotide--dimethylbenzimidazole phosphoribosyltransferase [Sporotomaculum syntrophicum]